jgi:hypothetical protein
MRSSGGLKENGRVAPDTNGILNEMSPSYLVIVIFFMIRNLSNMENESMYLLVFPQFNKLKNY